MSDLAMARQMWQLLNLRLGYAETGCHYLDRYDYLDDDGVRHEVADPARFLIKQLR